MFRGAALGAATLAMGLIAGLFYAYACSVMLALRGADDRTFIDVMQRINVAIINGWFLLAFVGALLLTALAAGLHLRSGGSGVLLCIVAALILYVVVLVITIGVNVPLNDTLAAVGEPDSITDLAGIRERFEATWVGWNVVRALASTAAFGCLTWALMLRGRIR